MLFVQVGSLFTNYKILFILELGKMSNMLNNNLISIDDRDKPILQYIIKTAVAIAAFQGIQ